MVTILTLLPIKADKKFPIRQATPADIDNIVQLLSKEYQQRFLAPEMDRNIFVKNLEERPNLDIHDYYLALSDSEIVGVCSAWDMGSFKKNIVLKYGSKMGTIRILYNTAAQLVGSPKLPRTGIPYRDITIAEYAVKDQEPKILESLLRHIYAKYRQKGYHSIIIGTSPNDPLRDATDVFISKEVRSNVILGSARQSKAFELEPQPLMYADAIQI